MIIPNHEYYRADWTITLADPFGLLKAAKVLSQVNVAHWFPVDVNPLGEADVTVLREGGGVPIAISRFGQRVLLEEGCEPLYAPHGVDTSVYCPGDPAPYRDTVPGMTDDTFVVGMVAMNRDKDRKGFAEQFLAFARFHRRHPDSILAVHSSPAGGLNLHALAARLGISGAVAWPDSYCYDMGMITEEQMAAWYRGLDVFSFCSYGEGFGLPLMEAQACGIPVITTDASAMAELCGGGWLVSGTDFWQNGHNAWWKRPDASDIEQAYEMAWIAREEGTLPCKPAHDFAQLYAIDRVFGEYWVPVLADLEERLG